MPFVEPVMTAQMWAQRLGRAEEGRIAMRKPTAASACAHADSVLASTCVAVSVDLWLRRMNMVSHLNLVATKNRDKGENRSRQNMRSNMCGSPLMDSVTRTLPPRRGTRSPAADRSSPTS